jgi:nicotinate phosphoribosyltransferase
MAHAMILILGEERAWRAFDRSMDPAVPRVALVDTFQDEKFGALAAAATLGDRLAAVRLDTPGSRRGDFAAIIREVRWELDRRGHRDVRIFVSGGLDEQEVAALQPVVDSFGVGTSISNAPVIDFAMDVVEVDGEPRAKRGKLSGRKTLWSCPDRHARGVAAADEPPPACPVCGGQVAPLLEPHLRSGAAVRRPETAREVRDRALAEVASLGGAWARS